MAEVERRRSVFETLRSDSLPRARLIHAADVLATALAVSLPWSTSATGILAAAWLIVALLTLEPAAVRRVLLTSAGGLPVAFWVLGLAGMLWATEISLVERLDGLSSFHKFLVIPLMIAHFQRSERGHWVMIGFVASCAVLLAVSWGLMVRSGFDREESRFTAVPVKDYIAQGVGFSVAMLLLAAIAVHDWAERRVRAVLLIILAAIFLANIVIVTTSRTAFVAIPVLLILFAFTLLRLRWAAGLLAGVVAVGALVWALDPHVRSNVGGLINEVRAFSPDGYSTRAGERLEFWKKSVAIVADAPLIGHGTGSIPEQFRLRVPDQGNTEVWTAPNPNHHTMPTDHERPQMADLVTANPHNQTLAVAIQLGMLGVVVLFAFWIAHLRLFLGSSLAAWAGLLLVSQNFIGSLFNSHLFDFTHGWGYVIGVGVAGGVVLRGVAVART